MSSDKYEFGEDSELDNLRIDRSITNILNKINKSFVLNKKKGGKKYIVK